MSNESTLQEAQIKSTLFQFAIEAKKELIRQSGEKRDRVIVISGPTACGKTAFSLKLAKAIGGEIVSADSMQVYRGMDVGTAKASDEEQILIPHHMIDICDLSTQYNVVDFYYDARRAIRQILARNRIPIIVGGSGFYLRTLLFGPPKGPSSNPKVRQVLEDEFDKVGPDKLYERLQKLDSKYAQTITRHDRQKIIRALEIIALTGDKVSNIPVRQNLRPKEFDFHCWFLYRPRDILYKRIENRCESMVQMGLVEEVERLIPQGLKENHSAAQAIGYKQTLDFLEHRNEAEYLMRLKQATRRYAKSQFTWFKQEPIFHWLDIEVHSQETVMELIAQDFNQL
jgi:tRNA dimethylallyltransferase